MKIFAIGDLHLPGGDKKPMDIFGSHWERHFERISDDWCRRVEKEDIVLIPGDISWAMQLDAAMNDLERIAALPGRVLILRGNHDYWWSSLTQLRQRLPQNMYALQNDAYDAEEYVICGTRGWTIPPASKADAQDVKIYRREVLRLGLSLDNAARIAKGRPIIAMLHFPPLVPDCMQTGSEFTRLLSEYRVTNCVYGHLHGQSIRWGFCGKYRGVQYNLVSCDALGFQLFDVTCDNENSSKQED